MDVNLIVQATGLGLSTVNSIYQLYSIFKKSNVEKFFEMLVESNTDISLLEVREDLLRRFFLIIDEVAREVDLEKLNAWKNAVIHLATDFKDFDYKDNFIKVLSGLTVFDLVVLYKIYETEFNNESFEKELILYFKSKQVEEEYILLAERKLASQSLIDEKYVIPGKGTLLSNTMFSKKESFSYFKNEMGKKFLIFISEIEK